MRVKKQQLELDSEKKTTSSKLGKEYVKAVYCQSDFLTFMQSMYADSQLDESQVGIKIVGRNFNHLRYADDTTLMTETKEELKSLLIKRKEESEKAGLKLNIQNAKIMASSPITSRQKGEKVEAVTDFIFLGSKITADSDCSHVIKRRLLHEGKLW